MAETARGMGHGVSLWLLDDETREERERGRTMDASSSFAPSPNLSARSDTDCVTDSTLISSSYVKKWFCAPSTSRASARSKARRTRPRLERDREQSEGRT